MTDAQQATDHVDVLIVGAGLSGIGAAARLEIAMRAGTIKRRSYAVLERRQASGGTWDLFRYPGVRSDSDMYTLGYKFKPWVGDRALADGAAIRDYVRETAEEFGVEQHIRYGHHVRRVDWDSGEQRWTVMSDVVSPSASLDDDNADADDDAAAPDNADTDDASESRTITADFLWSCSGYYDYDRGYRPVFPGEDRFAGTFVHPQAWPEDLDHRGKRVVVIGSGATAVTLVPALAESGAAHVTMLQRSPTYIMSLPARDGLARLAQRYLGAKVAYPLVRWKNIAISTAVYQLSQRRPQMMRGVIRKANVKLLPGGYDVDTHFKPDYNPWDQRLCLVPDGDLFTALRSGRAEIVTERIATFTREGIELESGRVLEADVVVTATGLNLQLFGGAAVSVDGEPRLPREAMAYRAMMLSELPNFAFTVGYTNASWTLKADLVADFVVRLLAHMDDTGTHVVTPERDPSQGEAPLMDFEAGYVTRMAHELPRQGTSAPWTMRQNYFHDRRAIQGAEIDDGVLRFE